MFLSCIPLYMDISQVKRQRRQNMHINEKFMHGGGHGREKGSVLRSSYEA